MDFIVIQSDITDIACDAIVLPANQKLKEGSGASKAIFEKAGRKNLTDACQKIGLCEEGHAVPTLAFNLDANYIIHAVVPKWVDGNHSEYELLSSAYLEALTIADTIGCESIAFPLLASGHNGFDHSLAFEIAKKSIESFENTHLKKIVLVVYDEKSVSLVKERGETVIKISISSKKEKKKMDNDKIMDKSAEELQKGLKKALEFFQNEKNREMIIVAGIELVKIVKNVAKKG